MLVLVVLSLAQCTAKHTPADFSSVHHDVEKALSVLERAKAAMPADSVAILREMGRVRLRYRRFADSLRQNVPDSVYVRFAVKRFISLAYDAHNIKELLAWQDSLILLSANYPQYTEQNPKTAGAIATCIVNSLEGGSGITSEKTLLKYAERAAEKIIQSAYGGKATIEQKRKVVDRYAVQYAGRGIISMAEPFYAHFAPLYQQAEKKPVPVRFSEDYTVYEKNGLPLFKLSKLDKSWRFMAFNIRRTNFDLVFLISSIRAALDDNAAIPFIVARNRGELGDKAISGIGKNISGEFAYINLNKADSARFSNAPAFVVLMPGGKIGYATNNAIDFLKWLRAPKAKQKAAAEKKQQALLKARMAERKRLAALPPDTSVKLKVSFPHTRVILRGYWPKDARVQMNNFYFGETDPGHNPDYGISEVSVKEKGYLLYNHWVIHLPGRKRVTLSLLSGKKHNITAHFSDSLNAGCSQLMEKLEHKQHYLTSYKKIAADYPYKTAAFMGYVHRRIRFWQSGIDHLLNDPAPNNITAGVLGISQVFYRLKHPAVRTAVDYHTFDSLMRVPRFDTILYRSPFYGPVIKGWLDYGSADMQTTIDLLFSSTDWIPENHKSRALQFVWRQMNERGREDMMLYIDTTYLSGCSGNDINVQKRLAGYKRMARGRKAPDIHWVEKGKKMDLYHLKADSIYVVFWADWCGHCKKFIPGFYRQLKNKKGTAVVAVCIDSDSSSLKLGRELFPQWHHVWASGKWHDPLVETYNVFGTPTLYLLNSKMEIEKKLSGGLSGF